MKKWFVCFLALPLFIILLPFASAESSVLIELDRTVTITEAGVYQITGSLSDGQIIVDADKNADVELILDNVQITSASSAPIYVCKAGSVTITLLGNNTLTNGGNYVPIDDNNIDAVIYAKSNLTLQGSGSLRVYANAGHGIVSKDTLIITEGTYTIESEKNGISGKDGVIIRDGSFCLTTGGGSKNAEMKASDAFGMFRNRNTEAADSSTGKGIKSDGDIEVLGGNFKLDCADDGVHCGGNLTISGGDWEIRTADDAIHADSTATIEGGAFSLPYCYEGIEGMHVVISGGTIDIVSCDDGINASGSSDGSDHRGMFITDGSITISGGSITIVSDGDCLDANGTIMLSGGTLNLTCNGNGNSAIDYETEFENNGAEVTTNDGSENGTGMMHGGMGRGNQPFGGRGDFGGQRPEGDFQPFDGGQPPEGNFQQFDRGQRPEGFDQFPRR